MYKYLLRFLGNGSYLISKGNLMKFKTFIGIDVSKLTLDICIVRENVSIDYYKISNQSRALDKFFEKFVPANMKEAVLVCAEHTGHYSNLLKSCCLTQGINLWLESGAEIKLSSGVQRNKSDKIDASRIAKYAARYSDKARLETLEPESLREAKLLLSERDLYVRERAKYKAQSKDLKDFISTTHFKTRKHRMNRHIKLLTHSIEQIDQKLKKIFMTSQELLRQREILKSIDGVGEQVAVNTIVATRGFRKYKNGRQFACHAVVAPFSYSSGTSQRSRKKVSHRANKKLKALFHMAALSAIKMKGEFRDYFERKLEEGKNKMTIINAIRAKIINRMFALIREDRKYQKNYKPHLINP